MPVHCLPCSQCSTIQESACRNPAPAPAAAPGTMQPTVADERPNVLADIKRDHAHILGLHRQMGEPNITQQEKQTLVWQFIHDLTVHSLAEEEVLYPKMKSFQGSRVREHALSEHTTLKHLLSDLDGMGVDHPGFNDKLKTLMQALEHHIEEEEQEMLPEFAHLLNSRDELAHLSERFQGAKKRVPTRPHPAAPDKPLTGNVVVNTLTAPIDKLRDAIGGRHTFAAAPAGAH